jgi:putative ABC transport system substrate-binding protein
MQAAARKLGVQLYVLNASTERDFESVFAALSQQRVGALVIMVDPFFVSRGGHMAALALRYAVPVIFQDRSFATAGGMMSYGASIRELYRYAGLYAGRILKGEKPGDLPVVQSAKIELFINLKTAKSLGIEVPQTLIARADEVIE